MDMIESSILQHSRLRAVRALGQQIWLDNLSHHLIASGQLAELIAVDGIAGVTSNPAIFHQAIARDPAYRAALPGLRRAVAEPEARYEAPVLPDVQRFGQAFDERLVLVG
ncbi:MAG TPA: transaldolase family protein [Telluria sp.]|nr:transaldolase family protein [Telluria sp.]